MPQTRKCAACMALCLGFPPAAWIVFCGDSYKAVPLKIPAPQDGWQLMLLCCWFVFFNTWSDGNSSTMCTIPQGVHGGKGGITFPGYTANPGPGRPGYLGKDLSTKADGRSSECHPPRDVFVLGRSHDLISITLYCNPCTRSLMSRSPISVLPMHTLYILHHKQRGRGHWSCRSGFSIW